MFSIYEENRLIMQIGKETFSFYINTSILNLNKKPKNLIKCLNLIIRELLKIFKFSVIF